MIASPPGVRAHLCKAGRWRSDLLLQAKAEVDELSKLSTDRSNLLFESATVSGGSCCLCSGAAEQIHQILSMLTWTHMSLEALAPPERQLSVLQANINRMADEFEQQLQESRAHMEVCPCWMSSKLPMQQPASMLWKAGSACPPEAHGPACDVLVGEQHGLVLGFSSALRSMQAAR